MARLVALKTRKGNLNILFGSKYLFTLIFITRELSRQESINHFGGTDYGHELTVYVRDGEKQLAEYHRFIMDGVGNGYGPSDLEYAISAISSDPQFKTLNRRAHAWSRELMNARRDARQQSSAIIYGYEGT